LAKGTDGDLTPNAQAVVEAFVKNPAPLPAVSVNDRFLDDETVFQLLQQPNVQAAIKLQTKSKVHALYTPVALNTLFGIVTDKTAPKREVVSASKAILVHAKDLDGKDVAKTEDMTDLGQSHLKKILDAAEAELAKRAKPVKQAQVEITESVFD